MNFVTSTHSAQRYCALLGTTSYLLSLAVASDAAQLIFGGLVNPDLMNKCTGAHQPPAGWVGQRRRVALSASPATPKKEGVRT